MQKEETAQKDYVCTIEDQTEIRYAQDALYVLTGKWRMPVFITIYNGAHRYREIAKNIPGLTFSMLSKELKHMEMNNLLLRTADPDFPREVKYYLTAYSTSLYPVVETLIKWGKGHRKII